MTDAEMIETTVRLRAATETLRLTMARSMIRWDTVESLISTSASQDDARRLIELAVQELRAYADFPQRCENVFRI